MLEQYDYTIMYISGERNCWGDLLFAWVNVPVVAVWAVAVFVSNAPDDTMPSKDAIRGVHQQDRAGLGALMSGASSFTTVTSVEYEPIRLVSADLSNWIIETTIEVVVGFERPGTFTPKRATPLASTTIPV